MVEKWREGKDPSKEKWRSSICNEEQRRNRYNCSSRRFPIHLLRTYSIIIIIYLRRILFSLFFFSYHNDNERIDENRIDNSKRCKLDYAFHSAPTVSITIDKGAERPILSIGYALVGRLDEGSTVHKRYYIRRI